MDYYVYLKLQSYSGTNIHVDTIPLRILNIGVSVDKSIPAFPIPLSGLATGESTTLALDLGMSNKRISLTGVIVETDIKRSHTKVGGTETTLRFTAQEVAQLIASGVDSTGLAKYQAFNELVFMIPSYVNENYVDRGKAANPSETTNGTVSTNIPFTFASRGSANSKDNTNVILPNSFPTSSTSEGLKGFVSSFNPTFSGEAIQIDFSLEFTVATILP